MPGLRQSLSKYGHERAYARISEKGRLRAARFFVTEFVTTGPENMGFLAAKPAKSKVRNVLKNNEELAFSGTCSNRGTSVENLPS
jgi:hypothetical protein